MGNTIAAVTEAGKEARTRIINRIQEQPVDPLIVR
jgi:hypothetical protein